MLSFGSINILKQFAFLLHLTLHCNIKNPCFWCSDFFYVVDQSLASILLPHHLHHLESLQAHPCFFSLKHCDLTPRPTYPLVQVQYIFCFFFIFWILPLCILIHTTHRSSLLYSTHHTLLTSMISYNFTLILILILLIQAGPTSTRCYRDILYPDLVFTNQLTN